MTRRQITIILRAIGAAVLSLVFVSILVVVVFNNYNSRRIDLLNKIVLAENAYYKLNGKYADLETLTADMYISSDEINTSGYVSLHIIEGTLIDTWWAIAGPQHPMQGNIYYINGSGYRVYSILPFHLKIDKATGLPPSNIKNTW
ncbi:MAG: hypothetical protein JNJ77_17825 [Planctomycetia bacterium]|nr:hypothetical protein [Planctomycetia bacterium]